MSQKPWVHASVISFRRWQFSGVRNPEICLTGNSKKYCTKAFLDVTPEAAPLDFLDIIQHQLTLQTWKTWFCLPGFKRFRHLDFASVEKSFDPILSLISKIGCAWHSFSSRSGQLIRNIQHLRMCCSRFAISNVVRAWHQKTNLHPWRGPYSFAKCPRAQSGNTFRKEVYLRIA